MRRVLVSGDEAIPTDRQHRSPCGDCPWRKDALPGWLGTMTPEEWLRAAHGEDRIDCHTLEGPQCAGAAIYRANVCKHPRDPELLRLPFDRDLVFDDPRKFLAYHKGLPTCSCGAPIEHAATGRKQELCNGCKIEKRQARDRVTGRRQHAAKQARKRAEK